MEDSLLGAALAYRDRGWSVIPISRETKEPKIKWAQFQQRLPTPAEIQDWWTRWPTANIALITGKVSNIIALDIDPRKGGNIAEMWDQQPTGLASMTGGGGAHFFYKYPGTPVPTQDDGHGVEVKGEGANVTLPPSIHQSGRRYEWAIQDVPTAFRPISLNGNGKKPDNGKKDPWLVEAFKGLAEGQGRNRLATRLAGYYLGKGMPADVVIETLHSWDFNNRPPLGRGVIGQVVGSVSQTKDRRSTPARVTSTEHVDEPFGLMTMNQYMAQFGDMPVKWAVEGWLPDQTIAMAVAPPGTYKTWLELALAISVASGKPFLDQFEVHNPGPVIIIQQEDYHGQMAERLALICRSMFDFAARTCPGQDDIIEYIAPPDLPIHLHPDRRFRFSDSVVLESLEAKIAVIKPVLVIIDPLYSTGEVDDFGVKLVSDMWPLKYLRDKYRCSFFIAHHTGKGKGETAREDLWGTQFLNAFIETGWQIRRKDDGDSAIIRRHFKSRKDIDEEVIAFNISTEHPRCFEVKVRALNKKDLKDLDIMSTLHEHGPISQADLARLLGSSKATVSRRMEPLVAKGQVFVLEDGRYTADPLAV